MNGSRCISEYNYQVVVADPLNNIHVAVEELTSEITTLSTAEFFSNGKISHCKKTKMAAWFLNNPKYSLKKMIMSIYLIAEIPDKQGSNW